MKWLKTTTTSWWRASNGWLLYGSKKPGCCTCLLISVLILIYLKKRNTSISSELMNLFILCLSGSWSSEMGILIMSMIFEKLVFSTHVRNMLMKLDHLARDRRENSKHSQNGSLMVIYHGRKYRNHLQKTSSGRLINSYTGQLRGS